MTSLLDTLPSELATIVDIYKQAFAGVLCRPYSDYSKDNICINNPRRAFDVNTNAEKFLGDIVWKHNSKPFNVELPGVTCISGVCKEMHTTAINGQTIFSETGTLRMICECSTDNEDYVKFREIMIDVYVLCLQWMYEHGSSDIGKRVFARPYICTHEELDDARRMYRFCDYLRTPITFDTEFVVGKDYMHEKILINRPQCIELSSKSEKCREKAEAITNKCFGLLGVVSPQVIVGRQHSLISFDLVDFSALPGHDVSTPADMLRCDDDHIILSHNDGKMYWRWNSAFNPCDN